MVEPHEVRRTVADGRIPRTRGEQVTVAQKMTRQAARARTSVTQPAERALPAEKALPTEGWYQVEDPFTTAETDAAFARFMAGDNPHVRTDEVPVVDFTSMIEAVGPDGRPARRSSPADSRIKLGLVALATVLVMALAVALGFIEIPGAERVEPDAFREPTQSVEAPANVSPIEDVDVDGDGATAEVDTQQLSITSGD